MHLTANIRVPNKRKKPASKQRGSTLLHSHNMLFPIITPLFLPLMTILLLPTHSLPTDLTPEPITESTLDAFFERMLGTDPTLTRQILANQFGLATFAVTVVAFNGTTPNGTGDNWIVYTKSLEEPGEESGSSRLFSIASISKTFVSLVAAKQFLKFGSDVSDVTDVSVNEILGRRIGVEIRLDEFLTTSWNGIHQEAMTDVSLNDLFTHSAGLDEQFLFGLSGDRDLDGASAFADNLEADLMENLPPRVWESGRQSTYSNYGTALAARVIASLNGSEYGPWLRRELLELNMTGTYYGWETVNGLVDNLCPLRVATSELRSDATFSDVVYQDFPSLYQDVNARPSAGVYSTSEDLVKYAKFLLKLKETDPEMDSFLFDPRFRFASLPGIGTYWWEEIIGNTKWNHHMGDLHPYHSILALQRDAGVAVIVLMSSIGSSFRDVVLEQFTLNFLDTCGAVDGVIADSNAHCYVSLPLADWPVPSETLISEYRKMTGCFMNSRYPHTSWMKIHMQIANYYSRFCVDVDSRGYLTAGSALLLPAEVVNSSAIPMRDFVIVSEGDAGTVEMDTTNFPMVSYGEFEGNRYWVRTMSGITTEEMSTTVVSSFYALISFVCIVFTLTIVACIVLSCPFCVMGVRKVMRNEDEGPNLELEGGGTKAETQSSEKKGCSGPAICWSLVYFIPFYGSFGCLIVSGFCNMLHHLCVFTVAWEQFNETLLVPVALVKFGIGLPVFSSVVMVASIVVFLIYVLVALIIRCRSSGTFSFGEFSTCQKVLWYIHVFGLAVTIFIGNLMNLIYLVNAAGYNAFAYFQD